MINNIKALLLATNQLGLAYVRLGDEIREIDTKLQLSLYRDSFQLIPHQSVRVSDISRYLLRSEPHIVHFSGHGRPSEGIILEDDAGNIAPVGEAQLKGIFGVHKGNIRLVFLNTCYSKSHAEAISQVIDYAIGMDGQIKDKSAIAFASSFYQNLAFGKSLRQAFDAAKEELILLGLEGAEAPALLVKEGADDTKPFVSRNEDAQRLEHILRRLIGGQVSREDQLALQRGVIAGEIILSEAETDPVDEKDGKESFNVLTRGNSLHISFGPSAYERIKQNIFPPPPGIAPPFLPSIFIGREGALEDIKQRLSLTKESPGSNITVVRGWPGVGKTTLVGVIAHDSDVANIFPQGTLWTSLEQTPNVLSEFARWGRALSTNAILRAPTLKDATDQLAALLRHRRMLLIVDDAWDTAHVAPFIKAMGKQCALLVTTRMTGVAEELTRHEDEIYLLPALTEDNALKLLRFLIPSIVEQYQDECRELVRDLECLPLAVHVAGRLLKSEFKLGWGVADLISEIRESARLIQERAPQDQIKEGNIPTVSALLMKSTNILEPDIRECFAFLGVFAPKPATFDLAAMKAVWDAADPKPIVRKLVNHGLLEPVGSGRFQMHRILVDHAKMLCSS
jgi:NB-ARC domain-containing protein